MMIPSPDNPRELFQLFLAYDSDIGLPSILKNVSFVRSDPRQTFYAVLGRLPESAALSVAPLDYNPRRHLLSALHSMEFQRSVMRLFCNAFPEKRRKIFIHVPKSAGSDLAMNLSPRYPSLSWNLTQEGWTTKESLFSRIAAVMREIYFSPDLFLHGHIELPWVLAHKLLRYGDDIFTIVRDPIASTLSQVNYILTLLLESNTYSPPRPDVIAWLRLLGLSQLDPEMSQAALLELAIRVLRHPELVHPNILCRALAPVGKDGQVSAQAALQNLIIANVEITDTQRYQRWLRHRWSIESQSRQNASRPIVSREMLATSDLEYIESIIVEDRKVYDRIQAALSVSDAPSIMADRLGISDV